jgi:hypothetical protein
MEKHRSDLPPTGSSNTGKPFSSPSLALPTPWVVHSVPDGIPNGPFCLALHSVRVSHLCMNSLISFSGYTVQIVGMEAVPAILAHGYSKA